jgi:ABC-type multidrug transport system permease subunit
MICIGIYIGQIVKEAMSAQAIGFTIIFPLTFASNAFVPTDNMPAWLKAFAEWNPISSMVAAVRQLFGNGYIASPDAPLPLQYPIVTSVIWIVVLATVGLTLAVWKYTKGKNQ